MIPSTARSESSLVPPALLRLRSRHPDPIALPPHGLCSASTARLILSKPLHPLILPNVTSEARDHCANERTFLSWLRLAVYMAVVSCAIVVSFHLRSRPSPLERKASLPVGVVFWLLSLACLVMGVGNYVRTVRKYAQRQALVQTGWATHIVSLLLWTFAEEWFVGAAGANSWR